MLLLNESYRVLYIQKRINCVSPNPKQRVKTSSCVAAFLQRDALNRVEMVPASHERYVLDVNVSHAMAININLLI